MEFRLSVDLASVIESQRILTAQVMPLLSQAVRAVAAQTAINWQERVMAAKLWQGERDQYSQSITWRATGDFSAEVVADYAQAEAIESGRPARDLKRILDTSLKVRTDKAGKRFLYIPFRHNVPGSSALAPSMPKDVYKMARLMAPSRVVDQGWRLSGTGASDIKTRMPLLVRRPVYQWGESLPESAGRRYAGMYRFDTSTGNAKRSTYLTFRTMHEDSTGWIAPAQAGLNLARDTVADMQPKAEEAFARAVTETLKGG